MNTKSENQSFSQLFVDYQHKFVRFANSYVRDIAVAEDFTSDALIYYWENRSRLPDDTNIPAYIFTAIKNKCLNHLQHIRVKEKVNAEMLTHAQWELDVRIATLKALEPSEVYTKEIHAMVNTSLSKLPEKTQEIFHRSRFRHQTNKEIARELDISTKSVEAHLTKAIKFLRTELSDYFMFLFFLWK